MMRSPRVLVRCFSGPKHHRANNSLGATRSLSSSSFGERLRIAVVGGGVAGLSSALHLSELVEKGLVQGPIDVFEGFRAEDKSSNGAGPVGRDIGVGVWSTALTPLSGRKSLDLALENLTSAGKFVGDVGYTTPKGEWLAQSRLPTSTDDDMPSLLFLREKDLLASLRQAVHLEERAGTVKIHWDKRGNTTRANGIDERSVKPFSARLSLDGEDHVSEHDYHLIVAADGMNSTLRKMYGGYHRQRHLIGTAALQHSDSQASALRGAQGGQVAANAIENRNYTVFRGNADMTVEATGMAGVSFQTWGEGNSMRFASVPMSYSDGGARVEKQVWFATTADDSISSEKDATKRRDMLLSSFAEWHDPIAQLIRETPCEHILMEQAVAHKHSMGPVGNVTEIISSRSETPTNFLNPGPALVFVGDAYMTVDPILAQGFTMAMEGAHELKWTMQKILDTSQSSGPSSSMTFDPRALRSGLQERHDRRGHRLLCLLRATELVQSLGQPDSRTLSGLLSHSVIRPLMRFSPDLVKRPIFDAMVKYSLGVHSNRK